LRLSGLRSGNVILTAEYAEVFAEERRAAFLGDLCASLRVLCG